ncbi:hypothetical protein NQ314_011485 [Rhamnusium bicolor]|uniref:Uncharacterized protein n=1 Tax=Rhamnusium bicolor TaxID=1586634 RepID=A0AAV8XI38_9CUCU|nr:hypothetical protein NQ314_011485 [Rhamnusium bicolor]
MDDLKIEDLDLYELLEIEISSTVADPIEKKLCNAILTKILMMSMLGKKFHQLSKALEVLTDEAARAAYDKVLRGKKEAALRHKELDGKRRKLKEDLEAREKAAGKYTTKKSADELLREEIERLRKEGSKQVEEEVEYVKRKLREEQQLNTEYWDGSKHRIKIKWSANKEDATNGGYTQEMLQRFLSKVIH